MDSQNERRDDFVTNTLQLFTFFAVGAVLSQGEGDDLRVVAYESRKMIDAETR